MRRDSRRGSGQRGSVLMLVTFAVPFLLVPLVGLAIDTTILRIAQAQLSAAVDGAALGAGRLLGTTADPQEIAGEFLTANFRPGSSGFWGSSSFAPTVTVTSGTTKTININVTVSVPLAFLRILGQGNAVLSASGTATRRDSRVIMVIDRSGSMSFSDGSGSTVIADVISYAQGFTEKFTEGKDELGLVVYDGSAVVAYPTTRPWDSTITNTSTGGPDKSFNSGATSDMIHQIQAIDAGGYTGMAEGLWLAYIEIQKAHLKDMRANGGIDDRLNSIVLFTDGVPTATTVYLNNTLNTPSPPYNSIKSTSACNYKTDATKKMIGWVGILGPSSGSFSGQHITGLFNLESTDTSQTLNYWVTHADSDENNPGTATSGLPCYHCTGITGSNFYSTSNSTTDLTMVPKIDGWGNHMDGTAYTHSYFVNSVGHTTSPFTGTLDYTTSGKVSAPNWALAAWNGVDTTANNIRNDSNLANRAGDSQNLMVAIYAIGYLGNGGVDQGLLLRVANDKSSSSYNGAQSTGVYVPASNAEALANAFTVIGTAILRLSQ